MSVEMRFVRGRERLAAMTQVAQRARLADPTGGVWEAADVQWWSRWRRPTDELAVPVWSDGVGPCAAIGVLDCLGRSHAVRAGQSAVAPDDPQWQVDPFVVPGTIDPRKVWSALAELLAHHRPALVELAARDDDPDLLDWLTDAGFAPFVEPSPLRWMDCANRPPALPPPEGFRIVDRAARPSDAHPMGDSTEASLRECSLYDPKLDLAMLAPDGQVAGYGLFWADSVTGVGMLEPMRVHDAYQRHGLAKALLAYGLDQFARAGIRRIKVTFADYAGRELHARGAFTTAGSARLWKSDRPGSALAR